MTSMMRPAAFVAALMLALLGVVAAPMATQAEVAVEPPLCGFVGPGCTGSCSIGSCTIQFHYIAVEVLIYIPLEDRYYRTYYLQNNGASCDCI
jgi:hypothetical protein